MVTSIAERVREARESAGLASKDLASAIGAAPGTVSRYENGRLTPSAKRLAQIAKITGTCMYWLTTGKKQPLAPAPAPEAA